jgi:A/G-specific adenine glycosylase
VSSPDFSALRRPLLAWYHKVKRDLPWRRTQDPYAILVSELMLQQTQVKTVLPYYDKFLRLFPTPAALAKAPEEKVLAAWAGLGYYRRARFLHAAARAVEAAGEFPRGLEGIRALPGVGAYTAAAVGSIAFGLPAAVVDGNVIRVVARLLALDADPTKGAGAERVRETAQAFLDPRHPGDFNQAMMELGAGLCSPTKPLCPECPLRSGCAAFLAGKPEAFPKLPARAATRTVVKAVVLAVQGGGGRARLLMRERRAEKKPKPGQAPDRLKGFWALPEVELEREDWEAAEAAALKEARRLLGRAVRPAGRLPKLRHGITVYDIHLLPFWFAGGEAAPRGGWEWVGLAKASNLPLASAEKKLLASLKKALSPDAGDAGQLGLKL